MRIASQSSVTACSSPTIILRRGASGAYARGRRARSRRDEVRAYVAERPEAPVAGNGDETAEAAPRDVLEEDALDGLLGAEREHVRERRRFDHPAHNGASYDRVWSGGADPPPRGARATTPRRASSRETPAAAKRIAERCLDAPSAVTEERGLLGFTGTFGGRPVSVQTTGMGTPSTAIVVEELVQLGVRRLLRVGTCGALSPGLELGELVLALSAVPARRHDAALRRRGAARADRGLGAPARGRARGEGDRTAREGRADRLDRRVLRSRSRADPPLGRARPSRGRDGGRLPVHDRRAARRRTPAASSSSRTCSPTVAESASTTGPWPRRSTAWPSWRSGQ